MVTFASLNQFLLTLPHAQTNVQWGDDNVYKIGGKLFAMVGEGRVSFKVDPADLLDWLDLPGVKPAPYLARAQWVSADLTQFEQERLEAGLRRSYELIFAKLTRKIQATLRGPTTGPMPPGGSRWYRSNRPAR